METSARKDLQSSNRFRSAIATHIFPCSLCVAAASISLDNNLNSILIISFVFFSLFTLTLRGSLHALSEKRIWLLPLSFGLWTIATAFWDSSGQVTLKSLEKYSTLLFLPIVFTMIAPLRFQLVRLTCLAFIVSVIALSIVAIISSAIQYQKIGDYRLFSYHYLSEQVGLNAIYFSNYCLASITWLVIHAFSVKASPHIRLLHAIASGWLLLFIFLLSSKFVIILSIVMIGLLLLWIGYRRGFLKYVVIGFGALIAIALFLVNTLDYVRYRFAVTEIKKYESEADAQNGIAIRLLMWESAAELIRERPLTGYGVNGAEEEMLKKYQQKNFPLGIYNKYNTHNQYLQSALVGGIPLLAIFISMIVSLIVAAVRNRNILLLLLVVQFSLQSLFEATFEVHHELVFFTFFTLLFLLQNPFAADSTRKVAHI
jgi:O-antigen ligase